MRPYHVESPVNPALVQEFMDALQDTYPEISHGNVLSLKQLCDEFQFTELDTKLQEFFGQWVYITFGSTIVYLSRDKVRERCGRFRDAGVAPYSIQTWVSLANFELFITALRGMDPELTHDNVADLKLLSDEFEFTDLGIKAQAFIDAWTSLVFHGETVHVRRDKLVQKCRLFRDSQLLLSKPYQVRSSAPGDVFRLFASAIDDVFPNLTNGNIIDFEALCDEFGFGELSVKLAEFRQAHSSSSDDFQRYLAPLKAQIASLKEQIATVQDLEHRVSELEQSNQDLANRLEALEPDPYRY
jgi:methyl-accepting chemotaxis protein